MVSLNEEISFYFIFLIYILMELFLQLQEYWSGLPLPSPEDLSRSRTEFLSPALTGRFFTSEPHGNFDWYLQWGISRALRNLRERGWMKWDLQWNHMGKMLYMIL